MTLVALASAKASPGVTTTTLLLAAAWPHDDVVVVEADPDGGDLAARYGLASEPSLVSAAAAMRRGPEVADPLAHAQTLPGGIRALMGPAGGDQAHGALAAGAFLADALASLDPTVVLVDCGRLRAASPARPLVDAADMTVIVARPRLDEVRHLAHRADLAGRVGVVCIGQKPYDPQEVADALGVVLLGVLADDAAAADALRNGRGHAQALRRSPLARSAVGVAARLSRLVGSVAEPEMAPV